MQNEKTKVIVAAVIIVLVALLAWFVFFRNGYSPYGGNSGTKNGLVSQSPTVAPVPANSIVLNEGDKSTNVNVVVPELQVPAHKTGSASYRQFAITANNGAFMPDTAVVNQGDIVDLEIMAVDKSYDFTQPDYGFYNVVIAKGTTKKIQFEALNPGKFTYYCSSCGPLGHGATGYVVVVGQ